MLLLVAVGRVKGGDAFPGLGAVVAAIARKLGEVAEEEAIEEEEVDGGWLAGEGFAVRLAVVKWRSGSGSPGAVAEDEEAVLEEEVAGFTV